LATGSCGTIFSMIEHIGFRSKKRGLPIIPYIFFIIIIFFISVFVARMRTNKTISPLPDSPQAENPIVRLFTKTKNPDDLRTIIKQLASAEWKNYSVYVKDMNSDFEMGLGEKVIFTGASINKVPILASLYFQYQKGEINMDNVITLQQDDIQDYGTGTIRYDPVGSTYTIKTLTRLMVEKSDNTAAFLLANYVVGLDKIQKLIESWGMIQTDMVNNRTSNYDMAIIFEKMYHGKIANQANTADMMSIMTHTDFEDRIPALLPKETTVYHKTGNGVGFIHDVGIVSTGKRTYYIGILTSDVTNEKTTIANMAKISKAVFDFLK
jgi:beta-lactamase class A